MVWKYLLFLSLTIAWGISPDDDLQAENVRIRLVWDGEDPFGCTLELDDQKIPSLQALRIELDELAKISTDRILIIDAGRKVKYSPVAKVANEGMQAGFEQIAFTSPKTRLDERKAYRLLFHAVPLEKYKDRDLEELLNATVSKLKSRLVHLGISGATVDVTEKKRILVKLPPVPAEMAGEMIIRLLQAPGVLEFLLTEEDEVIVKEKREELIRYLEKLEADEGGWDLSSDLSDLTFSATEGERKVTYQWMPYSKSYIEEVQPVAALRPKQTLKGLGLDTDRSPESIHKYFELLKRYDDGQWRFSTDDLAMVTQGQDDMTNPAVRFEFKPSRREDFRNFTRNHVHQRLAMVLEDRIQCNPVIQSEIPGAGVISGPQPKGFTLEETRVLIATLRSGRLMMALEILKIDMDEE